MKPDTLSVQFKAAFDHQDDDENARTPTNHKITASRGGLAESKQVAFDLIEATPTITTDDAMQVTDQSVNHVFESIFKNENDFQSFLDVLEKKEFSRPENVRKNKKQIINTSIF